MKHLDESINIGSLDESFSNLRGGGLSESTDTSTTTSQTSLTSYPRPVRSIPLSTATTGVYDLSATPIISLVKPSTSVPLANPIIKTEVATQPQFPIMMGGGGGSGAPSSESDTPDVAKKNEEEKKIFGIKSTYVYGLGAISALVFVYFKFIK